MNSKSEKDNNRSFKTDQKFLAWVLLRHTNDLLCRARNEELRQYGTTLRKASVLFMIQAIGRGATASEIARWQLRRRHTVSSILNRMEKDKLVRRAKDLDRKNMVSVTLTEKGLQLYELSLNRKSIDRIMGCLSSEECEQLICYLGRLRDKALKELGEVRKPPFP